MLRSATLSGDTLTVTASGGGGYTQTLMGDYAGEYAHAADDGAGGTDITVDGVPCYCAGTRILTDCGEAPVETLRIGDGVVTHGGVARPVRWIGRRAYGGRFAAGNPAVLPMCIRQGALGEGLPRRDLFVSPLQRCTSTAC